MDFLLIAVPLVALVLYAAWMTIPRDHDPSGFLSSAGSWEPGDGL